MGGDWGTARIVSPTFVERSAGARLSAAARCQREHPDAVRPCSRGDHDATPPPPPVTDPKPSFEHDVDARSAARQKAAAELMEEAERAGPAGYGGPRPREPGRYLPDHWWTWLNRSHPGGLRGADFSGTIHLQFEDGSEATFRYAFCVHDVGRAELAVFTEHCGHHVYPSVGLRWGGPGADGPHAPG